MKNWIKIQNHRIDLDELKAFKSEKDNGYTRPYIISLYFKNSGRVKDAVLNIYWQESTKFEQPKEWVKATKKLDEYFGIDEISL